MKLLQKSTMASIKQKMLDSGFEHILYGTIFMKDGVHIYLSRCSEGYLSVGAQKLQNPNDENSNVIAAGRSLVYYALFSSDTKIAELIAKTADRLVSNVN